MNKDAIQCALAEMEQVSDQIRDTVKNGRVGETPVRRLRVGDATLYVYYPSKKPQPGEHPFITLAVGECSAKAKCFIDRWHCHDGHMWIFVETGTIRVRYDSGETIDVKAGHYHKIEAGIEHIVSPMGASRGAVVLFPGEPAF